ncbi:MAG: acetate--CoA ligase family protein [Ottowia sp.]|uniref:acetate--CoA ligase family protein n=1 Tax=unclassified Ottowia TaxID=2645081 RepID=UPI003C2E4A3C
MSRGIKRLHPLLEPGSIVVVGASQEPSRIGGRPLQLARMHGFAGKVAGVNPKYTSVQGYPCFARLAEVPFVPDLAILAVGAKDVLGALHECAERGVRAAVVFAGGFAELGTVEGRQLQQALQRFAERTGMLVAGPNAIGLVNVGRRMYATFMTAMAESPPMDGGVAIVAQSGGAVIAVHNTLQARGVGVRYLLNTGNEACVDFSDYLEHVSADTGTKVVAGYIEGLDDGGRFIEQLQTLRDRDVPVVLYKVGETAQGADAAASHTARLAGSHAVFKAAFEQLGVLRADDMEQLAELSYLASKGGRSSGTRVGILTTSGAFAAILTDKFGPAGVCVPRLSEDLQARLRPNVPAMASTANPVDITANVVNAIGGFGAALSSLLQTQELDFVVLFSTSNLIDKLADEILRAAEGSTRMLAVMVTGVSRAQPALEAAGIPVFHDVGRGVSALAALARRDTQRRAGRPWRRDVDQPRTAASAEARQILTEARARGASSLTEREGKWLLASKGVAVTQDIVCGDADAAVMAARRTGFPAVLKILSPDIPHKTEVGGVRLGLVNEDQVRAAHDAMRSAVAAAAPGARVEGVVLQRQVHAGIELLVGVHRDPLFGLVLTLGFGGVMAELVDDVQHRLLPVDASDVRSMLERLRTFPLLAGYRNQPGCDIEAVVRAVIAVASLAEELDDQLDEIEINPLIAEVGAEGSAVAVDCVVRLRAEERPSEGSPALAEMAS